MHTSYIIRRSARRTLQLEITQKGEVLLRLPYFMSEKKALDFALQKQDWILATQQKIFAKQKEQEEKRKQSGGAFFLLGKGIPAQVRPQKKAVIFDGNTLFFSPHAWKNKKKAFEKFAREYLRRMAEDYALVYAEEIGVQYTSVRITSAQTRWGSCSSKGNLSFSWRLLLAPEDVVTYVIAHEVAHLQEMNHSQKFWDIVERICPEYKKQKQWLKEYGYTLFI